MASVGVALAPELPGPPRDGPALCGRVGLGGLGRVAAGGGRPWHCELCSQRTPPFVGALFDSARHRCRVCDRTVCDDCSTVPLRGDRTCQACYMERGQSTPAAPREKYVFLVRHAQSTWNRGVDLVKTLQNRSLEGMSVKDVVTRATGLITREAWERDHPISEEGLRQTAELRHKISAMQTRLASSHGEAGEANEVEGGSSGSDHPAEVSERERRYYDSFLARRQQIYCSPLLRALQTAHLVMPEDDGWGSIKLLKDARELLRWVFERDCLGTGVGAHIVDRAMQMGWELPGLQYRVDATDCDQKWWSDEPETEAEVEARLQALWRRLLEEDGDDSCVLVTHSNLIKALLMRFGGVDDSEGWEDCASDDCAGETGSTRATWAGDAHGSQDAPGEGTAAGGLSGDEGDTSASGLPGSTLEAVDADLAPTISDGGAVSLGPRRTRAESTISTSWQHEDVDRGEDRGPSDVEEEGEGETAQSWSFVRAGPEALRTLKVERLQNCGVLGLRCELEAPSPEVYPEVDGWVDIDGQNGGGPGAAGVPVRCAPKPRWVAKDALLMFDSVLVK